MRQSLLSLLLVLVAGSTPLTAQLPAVVIRAGRLMDGRGGATTDATITVAGGKILAVGAAKQR